MNYAVHGVFSRARVSKTMNCKGQAMQLYSYSNTLICSHSLILKIHWNRKTTTGYEPTALPEKRQENSSENLLQISLYKCECTSQQNTSIPGLVTYSSYYDKFKVELQSLCVVSMDFLLAFSPLFRLQCKVKCSKFAYPLKYTHRHTGLRSRAQKTVTF